MLPALLLTLAASPAAMAEPAAFALLPFGLDLYIQKKPVRAIVYTVTQALGVSAAAYGTHRSDALILTEDLEGAAPWRALTACGVTAAGASYLVSIVDASNLHTKSASERAQWMMEWDRTRAPTAWTEGRETALRVPATLNGQDLPLKRLAPGQ
ncbi:MAG: hypothetical protein EXR69_00090 [Myxococcales bacterium]|nr:hypothetical protein [Myxococcales bacterium]